MAIRKFVRDVFKGGVQPPGQMGTNFILSPDGVRGTGLKGAGPCVAVFGNHTISGVSLLDAKGKVIHTSNFQTGNVCANQGDKLEIALNYNFV